MHDALLALVGTLLVASADEWHQTFLPNRTGSAVGCAAGLLRRHFAAISGLSLYAHDETQAAGKSQVSRLFPQPGISYRLLFSGLGAE